MYICLDVFKIELNVLGCEKYLYFIYCKMKNKELMFNEVMDIYVFCIVVDSVDNCYCLLGVMYGLYKLIENRFKDYIVILWINGY